MSCGVQGFRPQASALFTVHATPMDEAHKTALKLSTTVVVNFQIGAPLNVYLYLRELEASEAHGADKYVESNNK